MKDLEEKIEQFFKDLKQEEGEVSSDTQNTNNNNNILQS